MEKAIRQIITKHQERDKTEADKAVIEKEEQYIATLKAKIKKIKDLAQRKRRQAGQHQMQAPEEQHHR